MIWLRENLTDKEKEHLKKLKPFCCLNGSTGVTDTSYEFKGIFWGGANPRSRLELFNFDKLNSDIIADDVFDAKLLQDYLPFPDEQDRYPYPEEWDDFFKGYNKAAESIAVPFDAYLEQFISDGDFNMLNAINWQEVTELKTGAENEWPLGDWALEMKKLTEAQKKTLEKLNPYCLLLYTPDDENISISENFLGIESASGKLNLFNFHELKDQNVDLVISDAYTAYGVIMNFYDRDSIYTIWDNFLSDLKDMDKNIKRIAIPLDGFISYFALWSFDKSYFEILRRVDWNLVKKLKSI